MKNVTQRRGDAEGRRGNANIPKLVCGAAHEKEGN